MIPDALRAALRDVLGEHVRFDHPMSKQTSLRVGGPADALASPRSREQLVAVLGLCLQHDVPHHVVGSGFNMLVRDGGLDGVVLNLKGLQHCDREGDHVRAEAGVSHSRLTNYCVKQGLSGLEFGAGIPGTIGGWVAMNAGIGPREVKDVLLRAEILRPGADAPEELTHAQLDFRYRSVPGLPPGAVVVSALFQVTSSTREAVQAEVRRMLDKRQGTQPIDQPSCGSVFKNPEGDFAGRLIESAGLKGACIGGAEISTLHANFIVNRGDARAADFLALIDLARSTVREQTGVELEPEVLLMGREK